MITLHELKITLNEYKKYVLVAIISFALLTPATYFVAAGQNKSPQQPKVEEVLGTATSPTPEPEPTPTLTPDPTPKISPSPKPKASTTPIPTPTPSTSTQSSNSSTSSNSNNQSSPTPTPSPTATPTPTPTPTALTLQIRIDYTGASDKQTDAYNPNFTQGQTAWDVMKSAIGEGNLISADAGGDLGIYVISINGVSLVWAECSCYWEFTVNGNYATSGVSTYQPSNGDILGFRVGH